MFTIFLPFRHMYASTAKVQFTFKSITADNMRDQAVHIRQEDSLQISVRPTQHVSITPILMAGCGDPSDAVTPKSSALNAGNINLVFVVSRDQAFNAATATQNTIDFFFNDPQFSNHKILLAWEHLHFPPLVNALLNSYGSSQTAPAWASGDYDSIWTVRIDPSGNLSVDNSLCEGIDSARLQVTAPQF